MKFALRSSPNHIPIKSKCPIKKNERMKIQGQKLIGLPQLLRLVVKDLTICTFAAQIAWLWHHIHVPTLIRPHFFPLLHKFVGRVVFFFTLFICETCDFGAHGRSSAACARVAHHQARYFNFFVFPSCFFCGGLGSHLEFFVVACSSVFDIVT